MLSPVKSSQVKSSQVKSSQDERGEKIRREERSGTWYANSVPSSTYMPMLRSLTLDFGSEGRGVRGRREGRGQGREREMRRRVKGNETTGREQGIMRVIETMQ